MITRSRLTALLLFSLALIACGRLPDDPGTSGSTPQASTSQPSSGERRWSAQPVLVTLYHGPGFTSRSIAWSLMPELVIYADGRVLLTRYGSAGDGWSRSVEEARIAKPELCALLLDVERLGFFDFDPGDYVRPQITDAGTTHIQVDAWRSQSVAAYALNFAIEASDGMGFEAKVPPALADTYQLLVSYDPPNRAAYRPERIALLIEPLHRNEAAPPWPLSSPTIADLQAASFSEEQPELVLEGQDATAVYALFGGDSSKIFTEGDSQYQLTMRPLLPLEDWEPSDSWGHRPQFEQTPTNEIDCSTAGELPPLATAMPAQPTTNP